MKIGSPKGTVLSIDAVFIYNRFHRKVPYTPCSYSGLCPPIAPVDMAYNPYPAGIMQETRGDYLVTNGVTGTVQFYDMKTDRHILTHPGMATRCL